MSRKILVLVFATVALRVYAETPRQFADRFYRSTCRWQIRGVPSPEERNRISVFFSPEILRLYAAADRQRSEFIRRFPFDPKHPETALKPPWCKEGDPFSDSYEGFSTFAVGRLMRIRSRTAVEIHLEYVEGGKANTWTDTLVLDRAGEKWVVADIHFARGGKLVADIREGIRETEQDLQ